MSSSIAALRTGRGARGVGSSSRRSTVVITSFVGVSTNSVSLAYPSGMIITMSVGSRDQFLCSEWMIRRMDFTVRSVW